MVRLLKLSNQAQANTKMGDHLESIFFQFCRNIRQIRQIFQLNRNFKKTAIGKVQFDPLIIA